MNETTIAILQYGALGLLALVLCGVGWGAKWFLVRLGAAFDKQTEALEKINEALTVMAVAQANHVSEMKQALAGTVTSDDLTEMAKEILGEIRQRHQHVPSSH